jgi:iduronate 2-sulfatase
LRIGVKVFIYRRHPADRVWNHGEIVREAQARFAERDCCAALVTTADGYAYSDPWHYDTAGFLDLGRRFADALHQLELDP